MTKLLVNDDGIRDPYTRAVEKFIELLEDAFPPSVEKQKLVQAIVACATREGLFYSNYKIVDSCLTNASSFANSLSVPMRDRVRLALLLEDCVNYSFTMSKKVMDSQALVEQAYSEASSDERALLASLAGARDNLFEASQIDTVVKDFDEALLLLIRRRRSLKRSTKALFKDLVQNSEKFNHPSFAR